MSSQRNPVIIHQTASSIRSVYTASSGSYAPSSSSYTPRSMTPAEEYRVYGAGKNHSLKSKGVTVINQNGTGYEYGAPTPVYEPTLPRRH
ncbi:hypothetical protein CMUS01_08950 [Colletotrichum musicola]|uniref:Uncharacterized protein n=1 Tax=Colletotrichum musicola TaxID=2175873 RepID=A0A8H6NBN3_9PEZI|nr:hypothetical protein CMUS01_08950 [Colletotrichum musicola]